MAGNGNSGRPPKPAVVHLINGNPSKLPAKDLQAEALAVDVSAPDMPDWLQPAAVEEWNRVVPDLLKLGLISTLDRQVLIQYCEAAAEYKRLSLLIQEKNASLASPGSGDVQTSRTGYKDISVWQKLRSDAMRAADAAGAKLGFSPMARRGLKAPAPQGELFPHEQLDIARKYF